MPLFYRGAGVGTYWDLNDALLNGFTPQSPSTPPSINQLMQHISQGTLTSPYVSLTRSYGVALDYALAFGRTQPTATSPASVYEIELVDPLPAGLRLIDPIKEIAGRDRRDRSGTPCRHVLPA